jgi:hypothetical protein
MISVFKHHPMQIRLAILLTTLSLLFVLLVTANNAVAQSKVTSALIKQDTTENLQSINDTVGLRSGTIVLSPEVQAKSGNLAMLFSAVLPGAGQVYAHRYYTIPLIWGFGYYFASIAIKANDHYMDYRGKYSESVRLDTTANHSGNADFLRNRDFYHNQRDEFIVYLFLTYVLNIIDAYVGATLYDFNVSDDLGGSAKIQFRVPLH